MDKYMKSRNKASNNLRMKASSLYFLNDISNIDSTDSLEKTNNWRDEYTFNPMILGRGHFSKVYKVKQCDSGITFAIKVVRRRRLGTDKIDEIMQEIEIMQILNKSSHSGFIQLFKVHTSPSEVGIVMEFASGGSLFHVTSDSRTGLPEVYVRIILSKVLSALCVIHQQNIVHLDIKADNILLRHPYPSTDVVLTDFGLARKLIKSKVHKEMIGTPDYIAPEVVSYDQICLKSDMWSVGVLVYFILTNISPFSGISKDDTLQKVTKTEYKFVGNLEDEALVNARDFIKSLLVKIPENRMSAEDCLLHEFLSNVNIVECSQEKTLCFEAPIINLEYDVQVRSNSTYRLRGMVMSQYDINSSDMTGSEINLLNTKSVENLKISDNSETYENPKESSILQKISMNSLHEANHDYLEFESQQTENLKVTNSFEEYKNLKESPKLMNISIDYLNEASHDYLEIETQVDPNNSKQCQKEVIEIEEIIDNISNIYKDDHIKSDTQEDYDEDTESETNIILENSNCEDVNVNINSSGINNLNNSLSDINTSCCESLSIGKPDGDNITEMSTSESYSILIKDESCKENDLPVEFITNETFSDNCSFQSTETCNSVKRCNENNKLKLVMKKCSQINQSFRNSRENILDYTRNEKEYYSSNAQKFQWYNTINPNNCNPNTLKHANGTVKRRALSKSIKKDCDKPQKVCENNRRSNMVASTDYLDHISRDYNHNISASNPTLNMSPNEPKTKFDFINLFRKKTTQTTKESNKTKTGCLLS